MAILLNILVCLLKGLLLYMQEDLLSSSISAPRKTLYGQCDETLCCAISAKLCVPSVCEKSLPLIFHTPWWTLGLPGLPQGMEALMRIENVVMLRKFQSGKVQTKITDYAESKQKCLHSLHATV